MSEPGTFWYEVLPTDKIRDADPALMLTDKQIQSFKVFKTGTLVSVTNYGDEVIIEDPTTGTRESVTPEQFRVLLGVVFQQRKPRS